MTQHESWSTRPAPDEIEPGIPATSESPADVPEGWDDEEVPPLDRPQAVEEWGVTSGEERAGEPMRLREWREEPDVDEVAAGPASGPGGRATDGLSLFEPGPEDGLSDDEADLVAEVDAGAPSTQSAEEAAMRVEDEPEGLSYEPDPGYLSRD